MCLQSNNVVLIAQEDIMCYKVYFKYTFQEIWRSPFLKYKLPEFGEIIVVKNLEEGLHTFSTIEGAIKLTSMFSAWILDFARSSNPINIQIVKCIIPKNSEYIQGTDSATKAPAYCSKELKFVESVIILNKENYWQEIEKVLTKLGEIFNL